MTARDELLARLKADPLMLRPEWIAYCMATAQHETAGTYRPIEERYNGTPIEYFVKKYGHRKDLGNVTPMDGYTYRGRGYVQITGRANYGAFSGIAGVDLINNPYAALDPDIAYRIMAYGMVGGKFTGRRLDQYLDGVMTDFVNARRIVNGMDQAEKIARYADVELMLLTRTEI